MGRELDDIASRSRLISPGPSGIEHRNPDQAYVEEINDEKLFSSPRRKEYGFSLQKTLTAAVLAISLLCNAWFIYRAPEREACASRPLKSITGLSDRPLITRKEGFYAPEYDPAFFNESDIEALWKQADPGYGFVALDREWALREGLAPSRAWKVDRSKSVYVFPAYHALHCARSLRLTFKRAMTGLPVPDFWLPHGLHCFEIIREELMCSASDKLYATKLDASRKGTLRIGEGEDRQCVDWEHLRDWVGERTAGYTPGEDELSDPVPAFTGNGATTDGWYIRPAQGAQ